MTIFTTTDVTAGEEISDQISDQQPTLRQMLRPFWFVGALMMMLDGLTTYLALTYHAEAGAREGNPLAAWAIEHIGVAGMCILKVLDRRRRDVAARGRCGSRPPDPGAQPDDLPAATSDVEGAPQRGVDARIQPRADGCGRRQQHPCDRHPLERLTTSPTLRSVEHYPDVDTYLEHSTLWPAETRALRPILRRCGLTEAIKWGKPTYSHDGRNILILQEMKDFLAIMFFKGALLTDPAGVLEDQGPNSRSAKRICVRSTADVKRITAALRAYVAEAIEVEDAGLEVQAAPEPELIAELRERLADDDTFRAGLSRSPPVGAASTTCTSPTRYKSSTRIARIDKHADRIKAGKGLRDR